ncbi:MAG: ribosome maturation factor RimP [Nitrospirota bacterium]
MDKDALEKKIAGIIEPVINALGMELADMEFSTERGRLLLRVFIDKEGGVTIDDCELVSREIGSILEVEDPIKRAYTLEVSSPGLDRPLKRPEDFRRASGKTARVVTHEPIDKQTFFVGDIIDAGDMEIVLLLPKDKRVTISYENISKARLEVKV